MCKHPLKGFQIGFTENGKPNYKIVPYKVDHLEYFKGEWRSCYESFVSPFSERTSMNPVDIPCGKCIDCRLKYSREWANRCMLELLYHDPEECWFLTLTYDDDHLPLIGSEKHAFIDNDIFPGTLVLSDLQRFMKRLRDHVWRDYGKTLRFFACGEYGTLTHRPHFHLIVYSLPLPDKKLFAFSKHGFPLYQSEYLSSIWTNGFVNFGRVSWETCAYTARYCLKKSTGIKPGDYKVLGVLPEFVTMSRRPGIASQYFEDHKDKIYEFDEIILDNGNVIKPPKSFDRKYAELYPDVMEQIKEQRKEVAKWNKNFKLLQTDLDYESMLEVEEAVLERRMKALVRPLM